MDTLYNYLVKTAGFEKKAMSPKLISQALRAAGGKLNVLNRLPRLSALDKVRTSAHYVGLPASSEPIFQARNIRNLADAVNATSEFKSPSARRFVTEAVRDAKANGYEAAKAQLNSKDPAVAYGYRRNIGGLRNINPVGGNSFEMQDAWQRAYENAKAPGTMQTQIVDQLLRAQGGPKPFVGDTSKTVLFPQLYTFN